MNLFGITRAVPKGDIIIRTFVEKDSKVLWCCNRVQLIQMGQWIEYLPYSMDSISNDNNVSSVLYLNSLINAISNCKKFYLSSGDIDSMIDCFGINIVARANMQY